MVYSHSLLRSTCCCFALAALSACTYLIPDDASAPRYNTVVGERHKPERNATPPASAPIAPRAQNLAPMQATPAPVTPVAVNSLPVPAATPVAQAMPLPPVDPVVQAKANAQMAKEPALVQAVSSARHVPVENKEYTIAENTVLQDNAGGGLMNVPPHPVNVGINAPSTRLNEARRDLEQSRSDALDAKSQLSHDVASEPSAFPEVMAPAPLPVPDEVHGAIATPPVTHIASVDLTPPPPLPPLNKAVVASAPVALPVGAPSVVAPPLVVASVKPVSVPVSLGDVPNVKSFNPMAPLPPVAPALKPIQLAAPVVTAEAAAPAPVIAIARAETPAVVSSLRPTTSDFDPLAGTVVAAPTVVASDASVGYLPVSRYASRR